MTTAFPLRMSLRPRLVVAMFLFVLLLADAPWARAHPTPRTQFSAHTRPERPPGTSLAIGPMIDAASLGSSSSIYLNTWRFHAGDAPPAGNGNLPSWAQPGFDDAQWPVISTDLPLAAQGFADSFPGFCWYRIRVQAPAHAQLSLYLGDVYTSYEVFADGVKLGQYGGLPPREARYGTRAATYALPPPQQAGTIVISVRVWANPVLARPGIAPASSYLGQSAAMDGMRQLFLLTRFHDFVENIIDAGVEMVMGCVLLAVYFGQRSQREWLWLGLAFLAGSFAGTSLELNIFDKLSSDVAFPINISLSFLFAALSLEFIVAFVRVRPNAWLRGFQCLLLVGVVLALLNPLLHIPFSYEALVASQLFSVYGLVTLSVLTYWFVRGNREAGVLILPFALAFVNSISGLLGAVAFGLGLEHTAQPHGLLPDLFLPGGAFDLDFIFSMLWIIAILIILLRRSTRVSREKQQLVNELEAARSVQTLVLSRADLATPGFVVESSYQPAQQVGGDFFLVSPAEDGSLILVLGDVSGKGLVAAMRVSMILGALRRESSRSTAEILHNLNSILCGQIDGFVTCTAAHVTASGLLTMANAGHLSPYLNGRELALENGPPLGVDRDVRYVEVCRQLAPEDKLTFLSDGIVEARARDGELYGFARTEAISMQSASAIAQAAKAFSPVGVQEDDITVVTIALQPGMA